MIKHTDPTLVALCSVSGADGRIVKNFESTGKSVVLLDLQTANGGIQITSDQLDSIYAGIVRLYPTVTPLKEELRGSRREELKAEREAFKATEKAEKAKAREAEKAEREKIKVQADAARKEAMEKAKAERQRIMDEAKNRAKQAVEDLKAKTTGQAANTQARPAQPSKGTQPAKKK